MSIDISVGQFASFSLLLFMTNEENWLTGIVKLEIIFLTIRIKNT